MKWKYGVASMGSINNNNKKEKFAVRLNTRSSVIYI